MKAPWKQVLSLALCGAVLTGALALGAGAADAGSFTDAKSVTHWQAVAALAKLDVISGKEDGSFDPGGSPAARRPGPTRIFCPPSAPGPATPISPATGPSPISNTPPSWACSPAGRTAPLTPTAWSPGRSWPG